MNKLLVVLGVVGLLSVAGASEAKGKKATVCFAFTEVKISLNGSPATVAVCGDGAKAKVLTEYKIVSVPVNEGAEALAAVGF